jgi:hypothetical protein
MGDEREFTRENSQKKTNKQENYNETTQKGEAT